MVSTKFENPPLGISMGILTIVFSLQNSLRTNISVCIFHDDDEPLTNLILIVDDIF